MTISWWAWTTHLRPADVLQLHPHHWTDVRRYELLTPSCGSSVSSPFSSLRPQTLPAIDLPLFPSSTSYHSLDSLLEHRHIPASYTQPSALQSGHSQLCYCLKLVTPKPTSVQPLLPMHFWVILFRMLSSHTYPCAGIKE